MESNDVWMVEFLKQLEFIIHHLLIAAYIPLENYLDGHFPSGAFGFPNDTICTRTQRPPELVLRPIVE